MLNRDSIITQEIFNTLEQNDLVNPDLFQKHTYLDLGGDDASLSKLIAQEYSIPETIVAEVGLDNSALETKERFGDNLELSKVLIDKHGVIQDVKENSVFLATAFMSMHHMGSAMPAELAYLSRLVRTNGLLVIREHDVIDSDLATMLELHHFPYIIQETLSYEDALTRSEISYLPEVLSTKLLANFGFYKLVSTKPIGKQRKYIGVYRKSTAKSGYETPNYTSPYHSLETKDLYLALDPSYIDEIGVEFQSDREFYNWAKGIVVDEGGFLKFSKMDNGYKMKIVR